MDGRLRFFVPDWQPNLRAWSTVPMAVLLIVPLVGADSAGHVICAGRDKQRIETGERRRRSSCRPHLRARGRGRVVAHARR